MNESAPSNTSILNWKNLPCMPGNTCPDVVTLISGTPGSSEDESMESAANTLMLCVPDETTVHNGLTCAILPKSSISVVNTKSGTPAVAEYDPNQSSQVDAFAQLADESLVSSQV
jgi:hypothetical protein